MINITPNPTDKTTSIVSNQGLLEVLTGHKAYVITLRDNIFAKHTEINLRYLNNKVVELTAHIEKLQARIDESPEAEVL